MESKLAIGEYFPADNCFSSGSIVAAIVPGFSSVELFVHILMKIVSRFVSLYLQYKLFGV